MQKIIAYLKNIFTARDNLTFSLSKLIIIVGFSAMAFDFIKAQSVDFQGFAIGVSTMVGALAAKYFVEDKEGK